MITKQYSNLVGNTGYSDWNNLKILNMEMSVEGEEGEFLVLNSSENLLTFSFEIDCPSGATGNKKKVDKIVIRFNENDILSFSGFIFQPKNIFTTKVTGNFSQSVKCLEKTGNLSIIFFDANGKNIGTCTTNIQVYGNKKIIIASQNFYLENGRDLCGTINLKYGRSLRIISIAKNLNSTVVNGNLIKETDKKYNINNNVFSNDILDNYGFIGSFTINFNLDNNLDYWQQSSALCRLYSFSNIIDEYGVCSIENNIIQRIYITNKWIISQKDKPNYYGEENICNYFKINDEFIFFNSNDTEIIINENNIRIEELIKEFEIINFFPPLLLETRDLENQIRVDINHFYNTISYILGDGNLGNLNSLFKHNFEKDDNFTFQPYVYLYDQTDATPGQERFSVFDFRDNFFPLEKLTFGFDPLYRRNIQIFLKIIYNGFENTQEIDYCLTNLLTRNSAGKYKYIIPTICLSLLKEIVVKDDKKIVNGIEKDAYTFSFVVDGLIIQSKFLSFHEIEDTLNDFEKMPNDKIFLIGNNPEQLDGIKYYPYYGSLTLEKENGIIKKQQKITIEKNEYTNVYNNNSYEDGSINCIQFPSLVHYSQESTVEAISPFAQISYYTISSTEHPGEIGNPLWIKDDILKLNPYFFPKQQPTIFYLPNQIGINCEPDDDDVIKIEKLSENNSPYKISIGNGIIIDGLVLSGAASGGTWDVPS